jgi:predicted metal-dependent phosphoesterase TrpH
MPASLLCELHAHSTWSDGELGVAELVDLYGRAGFDVLAVTDHVARTDDPWRARPNRALTRDRYDAYLAEIDAEAERAAATYGLLVLPGLELTYDALDPRRAAHAVAVGLREFVPLDAGLDAALAEARGHGAALIAAHPYTLAGAVGAPRTTARFAEDPDWAAGAVDRFEICNRHDFFDWVAQARLPVVATGDFHRLEHLATWKTLVPTERREDAVVEYLRSGAPVSLTRFVRLEELRQAA